MDEADASLVDGFGDGSALASFVAAYVRFISFSMRGGRARLELELL